MLTPEDEDLETERLDRALRTALAEHGPDSEKAAVTLAELFEHVRDRLLRTVRLRLDRRLVGRIDADDVLQDSFLSARQRLVHWQRDEELTAFVWLRLIVGQTMVDLHRTHLGTQRRSAAREISLAGGRRTPAAESSQLPLELLGGLTSPSQVAVRAEDRQKVAEILEGMDEIDREVLVLRHFEELDNSEVSQLLGLKRTAASNRYVRAMTRLRGLLMALEATDPAMKREPREDTGQ